MIESKLNGFFGGVFLLHLHLEFFIGEVNYSEFSQNLLDSFL